MNREGQRERCGEEDRYENERRGSRPGEWGGGGDEDKTDSLS